MRSLIAALLVGSALATPAVAQVARPTANLSAPVKTFGRISHDARSLMVAHKPSNGQTNDAFSFSAGLPDGRYRVPIFVNDWNMGQFIAHAGPQRTFPIPEGILHHRGKNHIVLAVTSDGQPGDAPESVRLVTLHTVKGGLPVQMVTAPNAPSDLKETK